MSGRENNSTHSISIVLFRKFRRFENESLPEVTYNRETNGNLSEDKVAFDNPLYGSSAMPSNIMQMYPPDDIHNPDSTA